MDKNLKAKIVENFRNTSLGFLRIKKNLGINQFTNSETEALLKKILSSTPVQDIQIIGKNHYFNCSKFNTVLTVNSYSLTIITAKRMK